MGSLMNNAPFAHYHDHKKGFVRKFWFLLIIGVVLLLTSSITTDGIERFLDALAIEVF